MSRMKNYYGNSAEKWKTAFAYFLADFMIPQLTAMILLWPFDVQEILVEVKEKKFGAEKDELFAALLFPELLAAMNGEIRRTTRFRDRAHVFFANTPPSCGFRSWFLV